MVGEKLRHLQIVSAKMLGFHCFIGVSPKARVSHFNVVNTNGCSDVCQETTPEWNAHHQTLKIAPKQRYKLVAGVVRLWIG